MIINQDCLSWMQTQPSDQFQTIVTSPPYNLRGFRGDPKYPSGFWNKSIINYGDHDDNMKEDDYKQWQVNVINECLRLLKPGGSFFYQHKVRKWNKRSSHPMEWILKSNAILYQEIIWNRKSTIAKDPHYLMSINESIYWLVKDAPKVYRKQLPEEYRKTIWTISPEQKNPHPAPYPYLLPELCIKLTSQPGDLIYDPFAGSGSTLYAGLKNDRSVVGTELNKDFVVMAQQRLDSLDNDKNLHNSLFLDAAEEYANQAVK